MYEIFHKCVSLCNGPVCLSHLFEVPQRNTAVLAGYCIPAGRCCHMWGHQHLLPSPVSPMYLKAHTGRQDRHQEKASYSSSSPHWCFKNHSCCCRSILPDHLHLKTTCWMKNSSCLSWQSWSTAKTNSVLSFHFSIVVQNDPLSTYFSCQIYSIFLSSVASVFMEPSKKSIRWFKNKRGHPTQTYKSCP